MPEITLEKLGARTLAGYYKVSITEDQRRYVGMHKTRLISRTLASFGKAKIWVILREGEVCGYLGMWIDPKIDQFTIAPFIIDRHFQRSGIGRAALQLACEKLFDAGAQQVRLAVHPENEGAIAFYEQEGFRFTGAVWGAGDKVMTLEKDTSGENGSSGV